MFLEELFAWMRKNGSHSIHVVGADAEGVAIKKRLQELLDLENPIRPTTLHRSKLSAPSQGGRGSTLKESVCSDDFLSRMLDTKLLTPSRSRD